MKYSKWSRQPEGEGLLSYTAGHLISTANTTDKTAESHSVSTRDAERPTCEEASELLLLVTLKITLV